MTEKPQKHQLVTAALYLVGGESRFVDTEDVAVKAYELAPQRFCWRKYPQFPNLELVRVFLSDAKKKDYGALVHGSGRKGWTLTPEGLRWAKTHAAEIRSDRQASAMNRQSRSGSVDSVRKARELKRIENSVAWAKWLQDPNSITRKDGQDIFRIDSYSTADMQKLKIERLQKLFVDDPKPSTFLNKLREIVLRGDTK